jgi:hypothetical protein
VIEDVHVNPGLAMEKVAFKGTMKKKKQKQKTLFTNKLDLNL